MTEQEAAESAGDLGEQVAATYLPQSVATAAGLTIPDDAPRVEAILAGTREVGMKARIEGSS